jgi:hypothetical protein
MAAERDSGPSSTPQPTFSPPLFSRNASAPPPSTSREEKFRRRKKIGLKLSANLRRSNLLNLRRDRWLEAQRKENLKKIKANFREVDGLERLSVKTFTIWWIHAKVRGVAVDR